MQSPLAFWKNKRAFKVHMLNRRKKSLLLSLPLKPSKNRADFGQIRPSFPLRNVIYVGHFVLKRLYASQTILFEKILKQRHLLLKLADHNVVSGISVRWL